MRGLSSTIGFVVIAVLFPVLGLVGATQVQVDCE